MDFAPVIAGFEVVLQPENLLFCLVGVLVGMVIGVLPGLGPAATIAVLLPLTYGMEPVAAIIMLAGIFYGGIYGGTVTAVLLKLPGETSSAITALEGYPMSRKGEGGKALGIGAIASFIGGTVSIVVLTLVAPLIADFALQFGPPEYAALTLLGILLVATISNGTLPKALAAAAAGLLLATIGRDGFTGELRYTAGNLELTDGLQFVPIAMGVFGLAEILYNLERRRNGGVKPVKTERVLPTRTDAKRSAAPIGRGVVLGFLLGLLPGGGATVSAMASYGVEKRLNKGPTPFGKGAIQGVAGPETANNAAATSSFIPLLTLGIPANATMAVMFGALLIQGITPGPQLVATDPELFWGVINSMYIGNLVLLVLSIPLIGLFVRILYVRSSILAPIVVLIVCIGAYTINNRIFEVLVVIVFGVLGYLMKKYGFDPAPLVLAFVLGSLLEDNFRRSLLMFDGDVSQVTDRPIAMTLLVFFVIVVIVPIALRFLRARRPDLLGAQVTSTGSAGPSTSSTVDVEPAQGSGDTGDTAVTADTSDDQEVEARDTSAGSDGKSP
ncbi:tripartite tricarboxylate transporter permease [Spiractinospora alimapuensis]|uniref:tripartite tricarboxylate transporter permease n=1 Tax=Spiractinospora alimapuensis TaxID=2820884 RepID=UPI001F3EFB54|nr:tripartite tricarboxylate transporter permease [Spiractinospora alimapuensis]QVQ51871.1 tripartite tricarboxylate transporter permease [Spiractinospora alimapuensis]